MASIYNNCAASSNPKHVGLFISEAATHAAVATAGHIGVCSNRSEFLLEMATGMNACFGVVDHYAKKSIHCGRHHKRKVSSGVAARRG